MIIEKTVRDADLRAPPGPWGEVGCARSMDPYYYMSQPNEAITLYDGALRLFTGKQYSEINSGKVSLRWLPHPRTRFSMSGPSTLSLHAMLSRRDEVTELDLMDRQARSPVVLTGIASNVEGLFEWSGVRWECTSHTFSVFSPSESFADCGCSSLL